MGVFSYSASHRGRRGRRGFPLRGVAPGDVGVEARARVIEEEGDLQGSRGGHGRGGVPRHLAGPRVAVVRPGERGRGRRERRGSGKTFGDDSTRRAPLLRVRKSENGASGGNRARTFRSPGRGCASSRLRAVSPSPRAARGKRSRRSSRRRRNAASCARPRLRRFPREHPRSWRSRHQVPACFARAGSLSRTSRTTRRDVRRGAPRTDADPPRAWSTAA